MHVMHGRWVRFRSYTLEWSQCSYFLIALTFAIPTIAPADDHDVWLRDPTVAFPADADNVWLCSHT